MPRPAAPARGEAAETGRAFRASRSPGPLLAAGRLTGRRLLSPPPGPQILPTSGTQSISVWDAPDLMTLHSWVDENLSEYCASECFQIVEEHSYGIQMELAKARVSENVGSKASAAAASVQERAREAMSHTAAKAKEARAASQKQFSKMDEKFKMTERAQVAGGKAKEGECATGGVCGRRGPPGVRGG